MIVFGVVWEDRRPELRLPEVLIEIGKFVAVVGVVHFLFDLALRKELFREVANATLKYVKVADSGIRDVYSNSKSVDYSDALLGSATVVIGQNYSPRLIDDFTDQLKARARANKSTTIVMMDPDSEAFRLLKQDRGNSDHVLADSKKLRNAVEEINREVSIGGAPRIVIRKTRALLRYSFVYCEKCVWVKPYRNSKGRTAIYALEIESGSPLYDFYHSDITALLAQCE